MPEAIARYRVRGTDTVIVLYEHEFQVLGSDEHGFFEALTSEHELFDNAYEPPAQPLQGMPIAYQPMMTTRLPVEFYDFLVVIRQHAMMVFRDLNGLVEEES